MYATLLPCLIEKLFINLYTLKKHKVMIVWIVCLVIQVILALDIWRRNDLDMVGKLVMILVVVLVPYMLGAAFYYFYAKDKVAGWFKK